MKRRNFLASLFALPFASKPSEALAPKPVKRSPEEWSSFIANEIGRQFSELQADNAFWVRYNTYALKQFAPTGFKKLPEGHMT